MSIIISSLYIYRFDGFSGYFSYGLIVVNEGLANRGYALHFFMLVPGAAAGGGKLGGGRGERGTERDGTGEQATHASHGA